MNKHKHNILNKITNKPLSTPELNHHSLQGRRSRPLDRALPTLNRRWNSSSQAKGFTIIEVVLVLAIAGLIFLMVFIALPALQRNQRDTQMKNDMSRVVAALNSYKANNRGKLPTDAYIGIGGTSTSQFVVSYLRSGGDQFNDPSGDPYLMRAADSRQVGYDHTGYIYDATTVGHVWITLGRHCEGPVIIAAGPAQFAVQYALESGGVYCLNG